MKKIRLIVVAGPTASGKTALSIDLAKALDGEIISADSMQIYKFMNIGSAKPTAEEQNAVPHHLIDFLAPDAEWSVADYTAKAHEVIADIVLRGKMPVMVGGTGLYINSVVNDVSFGEIDTDYKIRSELEQIAKTEGEDKLIEILREFDPVSAEKIHKNNIRRVIRAIEFYRVTGIPISKHQEMTKQVVSRYEPIMFLINWDRETLYERINRRVDMMFDAGLADEVKGLMEMGYGKQNQAMQGIGYKELIDYFDGKCSLMEAVDLIKQSSRRYAKRQLTWFRRDSRIHYLSPDNAFYEAMEIINSL